MQQFKRMRSQALHKPITLVFCNMDQYDEVVAYDPMAAELAVSQYFELARQQGSLTNGYECAVKGGAMLWTFAQPSQATLFCLAVSWS